MIPETDDNTEVNENILKEDDFFEDFNKPVQQFEEPEYIEPKLEPNKDEVKKIGRVNKLGANTIVNTTDALIALAISVYALSDDIKAYQMSEESKSDIIDLVAEMFPESSTAIPGWVQLILVITAAYTPIFKQAHSHRQDKQENKEEKTELKKVKDTELKKVENNENEKD